jgi:GT2 family glycosyltransferase
MEASRKFLHNSNKPARTEPPSDPLAAQANQASTGAACGSEQPIDRHSTGKPIALLIPVFCRQAKLNRALASLTSEADLLEVIVIDDGSEPPIRIASQSTLDIHLIRLPTNQGLAQALNTGMKHAFEGDNTYIARLDSDDTVIAGRFRKQLEFMEKHPSVGICGTGYHEYNQNGERQATVLLPKEDAGIRTGMHLRTTLWHPTVMIRASVARRVGYFNPTCISEDLDYFARTLEISRAANLPEALICYEVGSSDALTGTTARRRAIAREILQQKWHRREPFCWLWWLGLLAAGFYYLGINRWLAPFRNMTMRLIERKAE